MYYAIVTAVVVFIIFTVVVSRVALTVVFISFYYLSYFALFLIFSLAVLGCDAAPRKVVCASMQPEPEPSKMKTSLYHVETRAFQIKKAPITNTSKIKAVIPQSSPHQGQS